MPRRCGAMCRAGSSARSTASAPAGTWPGSPARRWAGASGRTRPAAARCSISDSPCSISASGWRGRPPPAAGGRRSPHRAPRRPLGRCGGGGRPARGGAGQPAAHHIGRRPRRGAVGERVRRVRERRLHLRGRDLAPHRRGRAVRRGTPREQGNGGHQSAPRLEGAQRGAPRRVAHRRALPGAGLRRLLPGPVGPLPRRRLGAGGSASDRRARHPAQGHRGDLQVRRRRERRVAVIGFALAAAMVSGAPLVAQVPSPTAHGAPSTPSPGSELEVALLTFETGGLIWERFGHNAILIHDAAAGTDRLYDYGRFSFKQAHFFLKFARGEMWYSMGESDDPDAVVRFYAAEGRRIWLQELDLTPAQRLKLRAFLEWNIRPENAGYAYDYYRDNCSTRIRDALDLALGGPIRRYGVRPSGMTWREETRRLDEHNPLLYTGLMIGLGRPVDLEMSRWEQMFLPIRLRAHLDSVSVTGPDGVARPVVRAGRVVSEGGRWPVPERPHDWTLRYLAAGIALGGLLVLLGRRAPVAFLAVA